MARKNTTIDPRGRKGGLKRTLIALALVFLILYIGAQVISRTEGIRSAVADKISNGTRLPVSLEKCGATPLLDLRLSGLVLQGAEMPDVKLSFDWFSFLSKEKPLIKQLRLKDVRVQFKRIPNAGNWEPLVLDGMGSRLGAVMGLNPVSEGEDASLPKFPPDAINHNTLLQVRNAKIVWLDEKGRELASVANGDLNMKVGRFIDRKAVQTIVECEEIKLASGSKLNDFRLEAFRFEGSSLVTVLEMSDREGQYPEFASQTLWQDLNKQLNSLSAIH